MGRSIQWKNRRRVRELHEEAGGDDAEALARMFEDGAIADDGTVRGRVRALLAATEQRWIPWLPTFLDMPGLQDCAGYGDRGFRSAFRDPWSCSRDQAGHFLTAVGLVLYPEQVERRRLGVRVRDLVGAPPGMANGEVALRLIIGHEKAPDPWMGDPLVLVKVRRQFAMATGADVNAFRRARTALGGDRRLDLERLAPYLDQIEVGTGRGNSVQDIYLSFAGYYFAQIVAQGGFSKRGEMARWIRENLKED